MTGKKGIIALILMVGACGMLLWHARFDGLGDRPLAEDEYYSAMAVRHTLETGAPAFHGGGYYLRALPLQYLTVPVCQWLGDGELANRVLPALFSVLVLPLLYFYARRFVPKAVAFTLVGIFVLSSWQLEFARFGRMYTPLQFLTLAFLIAYWNGCREGRKGWWLAAVALVVLTVTMQDLGVALLPLMVVAPWVARPDVGGAPATERRKWLGAGILAIGLSGSWYAFARKAWYHGAENPFPEGFVPPPGKTMIRNMGEAFLMPGISPELVFVAFAAACLVVLVMARVKARESAAASERALGLGLIVVGGVFHQLALIAVAVAFLVWRRGPVTRLLRERATLGALALSGGFVAGWTTWLWANWRASGSVIEGTDLAQGLRLFFFGSPDFFRTSLLPWIRVAPMLAGLFALAALLELWRTRNWEWRRLAFHPVAPIGIAMVVFGTLGGGNITTRYWFFLYPAMFVLLAMAIWHLSRRWFAGAGEARVAAGASLALFVCFAATEDFHPQHLVSPNAPEIVARKGKYARFARHWYQRHDRRGAALFLNEVAGRETEPPALALLGITYTAPYYLRPDLKPVMFIHPKENRMFRYHSRERGTMDLWSGYRLIGTVEELRGFDQEGGEVLVVKQVKRNAELYDPARIWPERMISCERVFLGSDGVVEVLRVRLSPVVGKGEPVPAS